MKRLVLLLLTVSVLAVGALTACRREVPAPLPTPDKPPTPTVVQSYYA